MHNERLPATADGEAAAGRGLSGWWRRAGAWMIDWSIVWIPVSIVLAVIGVGAEPRTSDRMFALNLDLTTWLIRLAALSIYFMATMSAWDGQTVGKKATGIRVVRESGDPVDMKFAFLRQTIVMAIVFNTLLAVFLYVPMILNYLWPLWDDNHKALHDKLVKSRVVRAQPARGSAELQASSPARSPARMT